MVRIARANRVAIQKILPTLNLWRGPPQDAGWRLRHVRDKYKGGDSVEGQMFLRVEEVAKELGVSIPYSYKLIRSMNAELKKTGCIGSMLQYRTES